MNLFAQHCILVAFFALLLEVIEMGEAYKLIRPYKYYQRRPWHRPQWYRGRKSSKFYHSKRRLPEDYYYHKPGYHGYHSGNEDIEDHAKHQPYTIVIQLPKGDHGYSHNNYLERKRNYDRDSIPVYASDDDYIEDDDDVDTKVVNANNKKLQIKMIKGENPKLHIKISRDDDEKDIVIVDKFNITDIDEGFLTKVNANLTLPMQRSNEDWEEESSEISDVTESSTPYLESLQ